MNHGWSRIIKKEGGHSCPPLPLYGGLPACALHADRKNPHSANSCSFIFALLGALCESQIIQLSVVSDEWLVDFSQFPIPNSQLNSPHPQAQNVLTTEDSEDTEI